MTLPFLVLMLCYVLYRCFDINCITRLGRVRRLVSKVRRLVRTFQIPYPRFHLKDIVIYIVKNSNVIKFDNDFQSFAEDRSWQSLSWKENQGYLLNFLVHNNLSKMYAYGSYYYLLFKVFNFKDLNFNLFLSYLIFYPYNFIRKIITKITKSN